MSNYWKQAGALHRHMVCSECGAPNNLTWRTEVTNGLTVHGVPVYVCPVCGHESMELNSTAELEWACDEAFKVGLTEVTLGIKDHVTIVEMDDEDPFVELMKWGAEMVEKYGPPTSEDIDIAIEEARREIRERNEKANTSLSVTEDPFGPGPFKPGSKVRCRKCGDVIQSEHRHDFRWCSCHAIAVDGGTDYLRLVGDPRDREILDTPDGE